MTYNFEYLYQEFSALAGMRQGNPAYDNDAGYWTGGTCNWGANHNLREDCQTIARGFEKLESLKGENINSQLTQCISKQDFELKKSNFIRRLNESTSGLQLRTGYSSSMFGICIIWADDNMKVYVESKLSEIRIELDQLKSQLGQETYQWVEELRRIQLEIDEINRRMEENKQRAVRETDPIKKQALIDEIENDGKLLQQKYQEHQEHSNKFRFDASKHVYDLIERMKKAIASRKSGGYGGGGSGGGGGNRRNPTNPNDPFGGGNWIDPGSDGNTPKRTPRSKGSDQPQNNQQLILIVVAVAVVMFFMLQKDKPVSRSSEYDYY